LEKIAPLPMMYFFMFWSTKRTNDMIPMIVVIHGINIAKEAKRNPLSKKKPMKAKTIARAEAARPIVIVIVVIFHPRDYFGTL